MLFGKFPLIKKGSNYHQNSDKLIKSGGARYNTEAWRDQGPPNKYFCKPRCYLGSIESEGGIEEDKFYLSSVRSLKQGGESSIALGLSNRV